MPRQFKKPKSIADWGGLEPFLDGTAKDHNELGYKDFLRYIKPRKHPISKPTAAEDFNISTRRWYQWLTIHQDEQEALAQQTDSDPTGEPAD